MVISFTIPGEPKGKGRPRLGRSGHAWTPKGTVNYENLVKLSFSQAYPDHTPFDPIVPVKCEITAYYSIPKSVTKKRYLLMLAKLLLPLKKPDLDNIAKIVCDALNGIAYHDDAQIYDLHIRKFYSHQPRVEVTLSNDTNESERTT